MIICLKCGGQTKVIDSRPAVANSTRRRRECIECGYRFTTFESSDPGFDPVQHFALCRQRTLARAKVLVNELLKVLRS